MEIIYILKAMERGGGVQAISSGSGTSCGAWALGLELNQPALPIYLKKKKTNKGHEGKELGAEPHSGLGGPWPLQKKKNSH